MSTDEQFAQALRTHVSDVVPAVTVRTDGVIPAARRRRAARAGALALVTGLALGGAVWASGAALAGDPGIVPGGLGSPSAGAASTASGSPSASRIPSGSPVPSQEPSGSASAPSMAPSTAVSSDPAGPGSVVVPDLTGMTQADATRALVERGLLPAFRPVEGTGRPGGTVVAVEPAGGQVVAVGSLVTLRIAAHPVENTHVPDVLGLTADAAGQALVQVALNPEVVYQESDAAVNSVITQDPAAGTVMPEGSTVRIVVSLGPAG